jgi:hypothetical protein
MRWIVTHEGPRDEIFLARQSLTALALAIAYGQTGAVVYRAPAQKAVALLEAARALDGGWGFTERAPARDPVVTARSLLALRVARAAHLEVAIVDSGSEELDGASLDDEAPVVTTQATVLRGCSLGSWDGPQGRVYETARMIVALESKHRCSTAVGRR